MAFKFDIQFFGLGAIYRPRPTFWPGEAVTVVMRLLDADTGETVVAAAGWHVVLDPLAGSPIEISEAEMTASEDGSWRLDIVPEIGGAWRYEISVTEPAETAIQGRFDVRWGGLDRPEDDATVIAAETGEPLITPGGKYLTVLRLDRAREADTLAGEETLGIVQGGAVRQLPVSLLREDARAQAAEAAEPVAAAAGRAAGIEGAAPLVDAAAAEAVSAAAARDAAVSAALNVSATVTGSAILVARYADLPRPGVDRQLYTALDRNKNYRWSSSAADYVFDSNSLPVVDTVAQTTAGLVKPATKTGVRLRDRIGRVWGWWTSTGELMARSLLVRDQLSYTHEDGATALRMRPSKYPQTHRDPIGRIYKETRADGTEAIAVLEARRASIATLTAADALKASAGSVTLHGSVSIVPSARAGVRFRDRIGRVFFQIDGSSSGGTGGSAAEGFSDAELAMLDAAAVAASQEFSRRIDTVTARPIYDVNGMPALGQSHVNGAEARGTVSRTPHPWVKMIGQCVRSYGASTTTWTPNGVAQFNPLQARTAGSGAGVLLTYDQEASVASDSTASGETILEGAMALLDQLQQIERGPLSDRSRVLVTNSVGVSGTSIEQWLPDAPGSYFTRFTSWVDLLKSLTPAGKTVGVPITIMDIGQNNYGGSNGSTQDKDTFKGLLKTVINAMRAYVATALNQTDPMGIVAVQTAAGYTNDTYQMAIGQAWRELADEDPLITLATSGYPEVDNGGGHLTRNGYRQRGYYLAKALHAKAMGRFFTAPKPYSVVRRGLTVAVSYLTTGAVGLKRAASYRDGTPYLYADWGFTHFGGDGARIDIPSVEQVAGHTLRLTLAGTPSGPTSAEILAYADKTYHVGNGNLFARDGVVTPKPYEVVSGMLAWENIPNLVGAPYPNDTPAVAGRWSVTVLP